jgi:DNA-binding NarL/FixJ family response regulator
MACYPLLKRSREGAVKRARILLAYNEPLTLEGLRSVLDTDYELVGVVSDGRSLLETALRLSPDVIVLDINLPRLNGIDAAYHIKKALPNVNLLFLTIHDNPKYLRNALAAGASGYLLKRSAKEELLAAVQEVIKGHTYVTPDFGEKMVAQLQRRLDSVMRAQFALTKRQREVLQLVAEGRTAKQIADILNVTVQTVAFHKYQIMNKLGLRTTAQLTRYAIQEGLVAE